MEATVILTSYNQPNSLKLGLASLAFQDTFSFELIVADDGSNTTAAFNVEQLVGNFAASAPFPVTFLTQPDKGFRKSTILNKAILAAKGKVLIFMDGDCVAFNNHVSMHLANIMPKQFCVGGCVFLSLQDSLALTISDIKVGDQERFITSDAKQHLYSKHKTSKIQGLLGMRRSPRIMGCNFSVMRQDMFLVNGFDENYNNLGKEDSDLRNRLRNNGLKGISLYKQDILCHLNHSLDASSRTINNIRGSGKPYYITRMRTKTAAFGLQERAQEDAKCK